MWIRPPSLVSSRTMRHIYNFPERSNAPNRNRLLHIILCLRHKHVFKLPNVGWTVWIHYRRKSMRHICCALSISVAWENVCRIRQDSLQVLYRWIKWGATLLLSVEKNVSSETIVCPGERGRITQDTSLNLAIALKAFIIGSWSLSKLWSLQNHLHSKRASLLA